MRDTVKTRKFLKWAMILNLMISIGLIGVRSYIVIVEHNSGTRDKHGKYVWAISIIYWGLTFYFYTVSERFLKIDLGI